MRKAKTRESLIWAAILALPMLFPQILHGEATWVDQAFGTDKISAKAAIEKLRREGLAGVEALQAIAPELNEAARSRWEQALDAVCAQRGCAESGLYWHTDLPSAQAEAQRTGRPILSLRLLGRLDEEFSCANSRFFRMVLYPDPRISPYLRKRYVLHWQSVRPVPRVHIDFGDGRELQGTITGNSIHYVLDSRGRLVDALPGLYGPGLFLDLLERGRSMAKSLGGLDDEAYRLRLSKLHNKALRTREQELANEGGVQAMLAMAPIRAGLIPTREAERLTVTKAVTQMPLVNSLSPPVARGFEPDPFNWAPLAERHRADWQLSLEAQALVLRKHLAVSGIAGPQVTANFEYLVGLDTVRNEYLLHTVIHSWLATPLASVPDLAAFNNRVYEELFLTPSSDPWLGLMSPETLLALAPTPE